ncbi:DUF814 domain-containing protein [Ceratocystis lukuohia]|uniref:DUF814 domain-containing protein n=1 Tax=Ceratocystis lukuohia TaxID=2019550 RepID=A0ABR4M9L9_9PEZI
MRGQLSSPGPDSDPYRRSRPSASSYLPPPSPSPNPNFLSVSTTSPPPPSQSFSHNLFQPQCPSPQSSLSFSPSFSSALLPPPRSSSSSPTNGSSPPPPPPPKDYSPVRLRTMASSSSAADSCLTAVSSSSTTVSPSPASANTNNLAVLSGGASKPATPTPSISRSRRLMKHPLLQKLSHRTPSSSHSVVDALDPRDASFVLLQQQQRSAAPPNTHLPLPDLPDEGLGASINSSLSQHYYHNSQNPHHPSQMPYNGASASSNTNSGTTDPRNTATFADQDYHPSNSLTSPHPSATEFQPQSYHHTDPHDHLEEEYVSVASTSIRQGTHEYPFENGRRYHWFMEGTYNFPNDADEQENEQIRHELVMMLFEDNLHFSPIEDNPQRILDLGTGTGQWAIDMADRYPSALLRGIDLSPIQPNWVPPNVCFMVDDMEGTWMYSQPFDLIHARHAALAVRNWPRVLRNSHMNLKPDGWIELQELDYVPYSLNNEKDVNATPVGQYWRLVRDGLSERGVSVNMVAGGRLANLLSESGFVNVTERMFHVPIGPWAGDEGLLWRSLFLASVQATALGPLTRGLGWSRQQVEVFLVQVIAHELNQVLTSLRISNIYDLSSKIFLIKLAKPDNKKQLLIETGFRCHVTEFARTTAQEPSAFVARLRKFLKTRRVTSVAQIGTDRVLEFQFSDGQYRVYLEFFASGNIILTDASLKILALQRNVPEGEGQEPQRVGLIYRLDNRQNFAGTPALTIDRLRSALEAAIIKASTGPKTLTAKKKSKPSDDLRKGLASSLPELPPMLVEHALAKAQFDTALPLSEIVSSDETLGNLHTALAAALSLSHDITQPKMATGYIIARKQIRPVQALSIGTDGSAVPASTESETKEALLYDDFHPFLPHKFTHNDSVSIIKIDGFNKTVDTFFSSIEGQKLESRLNEREVNAQRKLDAARQDQLKRIEGLESVVSLNLRKAAAIEANLERVQEAIDAVNGLIDDGMDWVDAGKLIEREQKRRNPVAEIIKLPMKLAESTIVLLLSEANEEDNEDESGYETASSVDDSSEDESGSESDSSGASSAANRRAKARDQAKAPDKRLQVEINLKLSPWSNAREYYDQKRSVAEKKQKTVEQATVALQNAEQKIKADLKRNLRQEKPVLHQIRVPFWFEKFLWFVSSDGYLVLASKDTTQADMLYKRHLKRGDVWVSADIAGACCTIIKNDATAASDSPIPPSTLSQAGTLAVASSEAWDSKAGLGAWWVRADQVTKKSAVGDFLPPGQFAVQGTKNFLPPPQLLVGFGVMFRVSKESAQANHSKHRVYTHVARKEKAAVEDETAQDNGEDKNKSNDAESDNEDDGLGDKKTNPLFSQLPSKNKKSVTEDEGATEALPKKIENITISDSIDTPQSSREEESAVTEACEDSNRPEEDALSSAPSSVPTSSTRPDKKAPLKRGQKAKLKKIATKYKYQDEEDRAAAELLLGATVGRQKAEAEAKAKAQREAEAEAAKARRRAQHEKHQREAAAHEIRRRKQIEADGNSPDDDDEEEPDFVSALECLVATPVPGDDVLEAIPVSAPWTSMTRIKYKVKLQPGAIKKGKAVREILERWKVAAASKGAIDDRAQDTERMWPREVELLRGLKPEEVVNVIPVSKVRVMISGGSVGGGGGGGGGGAGGKGQGKGGKGNGGGGGKGKRK